jgi:hypothetical protein
MPEFNLRQLQDIEYISDTLARPRGIRKSISPASIGGPRKQGGCEPTGRRGVTVSTSDFSFCVVVAMAACLTQPAFALDPRFPDWPCQQLKVVLSET